MGFLVACGAAAHDQTAAGGAGGGRPLAAGDVPLDIANIAIKGMVFEPEALGRPGMPFYEPKNKAQTIDQQKKAMESAKDLILKQAQAAVLATMMYIESKKQTGPAQKQSLADARQVLRDVATLAKDQVDPITLRLLGSYEIQLEDWSAAEKAWGGLVKAAPKDKDVAYNKAWWAYTLLKQNRTADAVEVFKGDVPTSKQPEAAYAMAWAKWRGGDDQGAWQAMVAACAGWGKNPNKDVIERDTLFFAGRSGMALAQIKPELFKVLDAKTPAQQYAVLVKLGLQAYQFAGRWADGVAALEDAIKIAPSVPLDDRVAIGFFQAEFTVRLDQPDAASRHAKDAIAAMPACGSKCSEKQKQEFLVGIYGIARTFHLLYATSNDVRYYQPAHDLYAQVGPLIQDQTTRSQSKADLETLEKTLQNMRPGTGTHEKQAIGVLLQRHNQEIQACYERLLAGDPKLAGELVLELESDATGVINAANSNPKAGAADLAAVATCAINNAKQWKLPKRGMAGNTYIKLTYALAKKS